MCVCVCSIFFSSILKVWNEKKKIKSKNTRKFNEKKNLCIHAYIKVFTHVCTYMYCANYGVVDLRLSERNFSPFTFIYPLTLL